MLVAVVVIVIVAVGGVALYFLYLNPSTSGGIGTSSIQLSQSSGSTTAGGTISVPYTVMLASGSKWGTTIHVSNTAALSADGITATPSTGTMDPTYSGTLAITTSSTTVPGTYHIVLNATGDDPSTANVMFTLTVSPSSGSTTTTSTTTTTITSVTSTTSSSSSCSYCY